MRPHKPVEMEIQPPIQTLTQPWKEPLDRIKLRFRKYQSKKLTFKHRSAILIINWIFSERLPRQVELEILPQIPTPTPLLKLKLVKRKQLSKKYIKKNLRLKVKLTQLTTNWIFLENLHKPVEVEIQLLIQAPTQPSRLKLGKKKQSFRNYLNRKHRSKMRSTLSIIN